MKHMYFLKISSLAVSFSLSLAETKLSLANCWSSFVAICKPVCSSESPAALRSEAPLPQGTLRIASRGTAGLKDEGGRLQGALNKLAAKLRGTVIVAKAFVYSSLFMTHNNKSALLAVKICYIYSYRIQIKKKNKCGKISLKIQIL